MILCCCRAVNENMVKQAIKSGCASFKEISGKTGLSQECGRCACRSKSYCDELLRQAANDSGCIEMECPNA